MLVPLISDTDRKAISELKFFTTLYKEQFNEVLAVCDDIVMKIKAGEIKKENYFTSPTINNKWRVLARKLHRQYNEKFGVDEYVPEKLTAFVLDQLADELKEFYQETVFKQIDEGLIWRNGQYSK